MRDTDRQLLGTWVECSSVFNKKEALFLELYQKYGSPAQALGQSGLQRADSGYIWQIIDICENQGIQIITQADSRFPESFYRTVPPILIYAIGDTDILKRTDSIGIIGSRRPSEYSLGVCRKFAGEIAASGKAVISGFALGIDQCAHSACISAGGLTAAVLGSGIGHDYPMGSLGLQRDIAAHGVVISEFPPNTKPVPENFIRRNRLISALSQKLLVVEASSRSGCLNTASHALDQGSDIFVIPPHRLDSDRYAGQSELIRDGAYIAFQPSDLL